MPTPSTINKLTIIRIQVHLPGDEEEGDLMETETVAVQKPRQEEQSFNLIEGTSRYILVHLGED